MRSLWGTDTKLLMRSGAWWTLIATLSVLLVGSLWVGSTRQNRELTTIERMTDQRDSIWSMHLADAQKYLGGTLDEDFLSPLDGYLTWGFTDLVAGRARAPLGLLAVGQSDLLATYHVWSNATPNVLFHEREIANPTAQSLGWLDLSVVVVVLLPLLVIGLSFDLTAKDDTDGISRLMHAQGTPARGLYLRRALLRWGWSTVVIGPLLIFGALLLSPAARSAEGVVALAALVVVVGAYAAWWQAISYWVNSLRRNALWNASALVGIWALTVLVAPPIVDRWAGGAETATLDRDMAVWSEEFAVDADSTYAAFRAAQAGELELPEEPIGLASAVTLFQELRARRHQRSAIERDDALVREARVRSAATLLPTASVRFAITDLSGNDTPSLLRYQAAREEYERSWAGSLRVPPLTGEEFTLEALANAPSWSAPPPAVTLPRPLLLLVLLVQTGLFGLAGWVRFQRHPLPGV